MPFAAVESAGDGLLLARGMALGIGLLAVVAGSAFATNLRGERSGLPRLGLPERLAALTFAPAGVALLAALYGLAGALSIALPVVVATVVLEGRRVGLFEVRALGRPRRRRAEEEAQREAR
jgi:hypothetical protein